MGKKKSKSQGNISLGVHSNVASNIKNAVRKAYLGSADRIINQMKAHRSGKNVMVTISNPNKNETNRSFIRVPASIAWGKPKAGGYSNK
tara:strand:+ start:18906 stop:19172 length:267 start_codon:yes stop_codon:yes gene_type:complete